MQCGFFRRGTKEELERLINQEGNYNDVDSIYEQIPENGAAGGLVELHPQQGTAGFVALQDHAGMYDRYKSISGKHNNTIQNSGYMCVWTRKCILHAHNMLWKLFFPLI